MAEADRENIFDYIAADNPRAAIDLDETFRACVERAALQPELYRAGRVRGTREIVVRPNYVMVYQIEDKSGTLIVLRVLHTSQQWPSR